ncbi:unnamed protein product [Rotaria sp. Silwood2]|nr:unnamed protein product [Rotaria sp. Silwood2]
MKELASYTHIESTPRYQALIDMVNTINTSPRCRQYMLKWNLRLGDNLVELEDRTLEAETINYSDRSVRYKQQETDWSRDGRNCRHIKPGHLDKWLVVYERKQKPIVNELINTLYNVCTLMGMRVEYPEIAELQNDRPETYLKALEQNCFNQQYNLVLCVLNNNRKDRYDVLKKFSCMDTVIPSQMVLLKTLNKHGQLMSVATKIGVQISAKLGEEIWSVTIPSKSLMIIGIDSYRDINIKRKQVSIAAFVATTNPQCTSYYSRIIMQTTTQELVDGISVCIRDALKAFFMQNNAKPERIVIYCDGVGDGQLQAVYEHESPQIEETFSKVQEGYTPKWAMIIVKTRGTIIDHTITHQNWFDFYLISQCARQGTAAPTLFNVIWDRTTFKVDHIQQLTFKLCHLYYNWPMSDCNGDGDGKKYDPLKKLQEMVDKLPPVDETSTDQSNQQQQRQQKNRKKQTPVYTVEDVDDDDVIVTGQNHANQGGGTVGVGLNQGGGTVGVGLNQGGGTVGVGLNQGGGTVGVGLNQGGGTGVASFNQGGHIGATRSKQGGLIFEMQSHDISDLIALAAEDLVYLLLRLAVLGCKIIYLLFKKILFFI